MPTAFHTQTASTIDDADVARFTAMAQQWWNEHGKFAPLHRLNPARIGYIRDHIIKHFQIDAHEKPLAHLSLLDVGCGGGLICEPMARLGANVTGIDAGAQNISVAALHAKSSGLTIDYRHSSAEELAAQGATFDMVLALEIIEHVANPALFYQSLQALVKPGGLLILSTINRTAKSYVMAIIGAEYVLRWLPRGTHNWKQFVKPSEMASALEKQQLSVVDTAGLVFNPLRNGFRIDPQDLDVNYLMVARKSR